MPTASPSSAIEGRVRKTEMIDRLQRATDRSYRRLFSAVRADWERLFGGTEPSDGCVSVRIHSAANTTEKRAVPGSGFLPKRASHPNGKTRERFACTNI
jgi:hypothetical protein